MSSFRDIVRQVTPKSIRRLYRRMYPYQTSSTTLDWVLSNLTSAPHLIFDVGANIGMMTLEFLEYYPKSTIYAFEPCADSFEVLKKNLAPHLSRVRLYPFGFSSESRKAFLKIATFHGANSLVGMSRDYLNGHPDIKLLRKEEIQLVTLDDFVDEHSVEHIDLVKIDVEGSERQILNGGKETFISRVDSVLMEVSLARHGFDSDEWIQLIQKMHGYGFDLVAMYDISYNRWPNYGTRLEQFDAVFCKRGRALFK